MYELGFTAVLIVVGYIFGASREKAHFESIQRREKELLYMPVRADKILKMDQVERVALVTSGVVIAGDYFKSIATSLKSFIGGTVNSQETLLDRARREAILRLKEKARRLGAQEIVGLRIETTTIDQQGVEVMVYGNAVFGKNKII